MIVSGLDQRRAAASAPGSPRSDSSRRRRPSCDAGDRVAVQLGNAVDEAAEQLGRLMRLLVPALIGRRHRRAGSRRRDRRRGCRARGSRARSACDWPCGKRGEDQVDAVERGRREPLDRARRDRRARDADGPSASGRPAWLSPNSRAGRKRRMAGAEPQQLRADESRGSKDGDVDHARPYAHSCIIMQYGKLRPWPQAPVGNRNTVSALVCISIFLCASGMSI